jgi:hypothetical protein
VRKLSTRGPLGWSSSWVQASRGPNRTAVWGQQMLCRGSRP